VLKHCFRLRNIYSRGSVCCGGGEIRTLGGLPHTDFPGLRTRPLCDASLHYSSYSPILIELTHTALKSVFSQATTLPTSPGYTWRMSTLNTKEFARTDVWREGAWLDLWSVVHLCSGTALGLFLYLLHLGTTATILIALLLLISYELWEAMVKIAEAPTNRFMDVVVGMVSFTPTFLFFARSLTAAQFAWTFGSILVITSTLSAFGWHASQKAATLEKRLQEKFAARRSRLTSRAKGRARR